MPASLPPSPSLARVVALFDDPQWHLGPAAYRMSATDAGSWQLEAQDDTHAPTVNWRRLKAGGADVTLGSTVGKDAFSASRGGVIRFGWRSRIFVSQLPAAYPSVIRMSERVNVTKEDGTDWEAFNLTHDGFLGVGEDGERCDAITNIDTLGESVGSAIGFRARRAVTSIVSGVLPIGKASGSYISLDVAGGATITTITAGNLAGFPILVIVNANATSVTIAHSTGNIRLNGKADLTLAVQQGITLIRTSGNVWQQI